MIRLHMSNGCNVRTCGSRRCYQRSKYVVCALQASHTTPKLTGADVGVGSFFPGYAAVRFTFLYIGMELYTVYQVYILCLYLYIYIFIYSDYQNDSEAAAKRVRALQSVEKIIVYL